MHQGWLTTHEKVDCIFNNFPPSSYLQVLDFGCAEAKLVKVLISQETLSHLDEVVGVDVDKELLEENKFRIRPLISDYLRPRTHPFKVSLYQGMDIITIS